MFLKRLHKAPSGILVNGCVLLELLSDHLAVFRAGRRNKFNIRLDTLSRILHLFIGIVNILWLMPCVSHSLHTTGEKQGFLIIV